MPALPVVRPAPISSRANRLSSVACIFGIIATLICASAWRRLHGTTAAAPLAWAVVSLVALTADAGSSLVSFGGNRLATLHLDYLAGLTTLAPFVSLLGAKRPQDRAWQLIVVSLLALLALQDLRIWSIDHTRPPMPHAAWCWLVAAIVGMQLLNYLPTRHAPAACLACWAQMCSLGPSFRLLPADVRPSWLALPLLLLTAVMVAWLSRHPRPKWQSAWADFRNLYGVLWTLRVAERVNAIAAEKRLAVRLSWHGWQVGNSAGGKTDNDDRREATKALQAILLRFVNQQWLSAREHDSGCPSHPAFPPSAVK